MEALDTAYITLMSKKDGAGHVKDFRPISLVHSFAKVNTKVLANHLATWLHLMVSESKCLKKHFLQDNFILVQQMAKFLHQQKQPHLLLKLDITVVI